MSDELDARARALAADPADDGIAARLRLILGRPGTWEVPGVRPDLPAGEADDDEIDGWLDEADLELPFLAGSVVAADLAAGDDVTAATGAGDENVDATAEPAAAGPAEPAAGPAVVDLGERRSARWGRGRRVGTIAAVAAAAAAVVVFGLSLLVPSQHTGKADLVGTAAAPAARARVAVVNLDAGAQFTLYIDGLPPAAPGTYYEAWLRKDGATIPLGSFHLHQPGAVIVWSGVEWAGAELTVTRQRVDAGLVPGERVLDGQLPT
jgi:Anti-sigma-K factor rskA